MRNVNYAAALLKVIIRPGCSRTQHGVHSQKTKPWELQGVKDQFILADRRPRGKGGDHHLFYFSPFMNNTHFDWLCWLQLILGKIQMKDNIHFHFHPHSDKPKNKLFSTLCRNVLSMKSFFKNIYNRKKNVSDIIGSISPPCVNLNLGNWPNVC